MAELSFPHVEQKIEDFLYDEEGSIPVGKVLTIGSMILILGLLMADDAFAAHRSHSSHSSHSSHQSGYSGGHSSHTSHASHQSSYYDAAPAAPSSGGSSAASAASHASHSNVAPSAAEVQSLYAVGSGDTVHLDAAEHALQPAADVPATTSLHAPDAQEP